MTEKIIKVDYKEEMEQSYIDYAMSVIIQRAIPDLRDGLKPVHRRILYAMKDLNLDYNKPYKKSARIVGDVLGKYHPHSDSSVYDAMVRLAQEFNTNHPLVEGQGNFGSIDGDPPAAMRYTEARLEAISENLLIGLNKELIPFQDNFDNSMKEPEVLPAKFFNLLVNGSTGIAVGMSTNIPPHNLREVNNACKAYLDNKNITNKGLLRYIKGPDFPTGGTIINGDEISKIYEKGNGRVRVRANFEVEDLKGGRKNLIITEIPYTLAGNKNRILEEIIDLINERKLDEISDIRDESSRDGIRIVLEVKRGIDIERLKIKLYDLTRLEDTVTINMLSIVDNKPVVLSLKDMIKTYMEFLIDLYLKEFQYDLNKLKAEREIKIGLIKAAESIDSIIDIIRNSKNREEVLNSLMTGNVKNIKFSNSKNKKVAESFNFTKNQAESILRMQLQSLVSIEVEKLITELNNIDEKLSNLNKLIKDEEFLKEHIKKDLDDLKNKFGKNRKTKIKVIEEKSYEEEEIIEDVYALIDRFNYIKIIDTQSFTRTNEETLESYKYVIPLKSNDSVWIFADDANFYQVKLEDLPISKMSDRGTPLSNKWNILYAGSREELIDKELIYATKDGYVKRVDGKEFDTIRRELIATRKSSDSDKIIFVAPIIDEKEIVLITKKKRKIRFLIEEISKQKRMAMGVKGINLNIGDEVETVKIEKNTDNRKRTRGSKGEVL